MSDLPIAPASHSVDLSHRLDGVAVVIGCIRVTSGTSPSPGKELYQRQPHAPVLLALFLDLGDANRPDLTGCANMRSAARLQVESCDLDQAHAAGPHRRF